jgi:hypothetical protein
MIKMGGRIRAVRTLGKVEKIAIENELEGRKQPEREGKQNCVADPGCLSRILIFTHPGSRISDPGSKNSNKRER